MASLGVSRRILWAFAAALAVGAIATTVIALATRSSPVDHAVSALRHRSVYFAPGSTTMSRHAAVRLEHEIDRLLVDMRVAMFAPDAGDAEELFDEVQHRLGPHTALVVGLGGRTLTDGHPGVKALAARAFDADDFNNAALPDLARRIKAAQRWGWPADPKEVEVEPEGSGIGIPALALIGCVAYLVLSVGLRSRRARRRAHRIGA